MSTIQLGAYRKIAWRRYLEWLYSASVEELEQLDAALHHLPSPMSLIQAIEHALSNPWSRDCMPSSLLAQFDAAHADGLRQIAA